MPAMAAMFVVSMMIMVLVVLILFMLLPLAFVFPAIPLTIVTFDVDRLRLDVDRAGLDVHGRRRGIRARDVDIDIHVRRTGGERHQ